MGRPLDEDIIIKILERWQKAFKENSHYVSASDLSLVIKDVRELPTIQSVATDTNVGDTISRQAAIDEIKNYCENGCDIAEDNWCPGCQREQFIELLKALPTIQPERKRGEWLPDNNNAYEMRFVCSCCKESEVVPTIGFTKYKPLWDFCPNCGADMRGEKDG